VLSAIYNTIIENTRAALSLLVKEAVDVGPGVAENNINLLGGFSRKGLGFVQTESIDDVVYELIAFCFFSLIHSPRVVAYMANAENRKNTVVGSKCVSVF
jgi:hypothetical protein